MPTLNHETVPYGSWSSPITSDLIAAHPIRLGDVSVDGDTLYWIEARPSEQGRCVIVRRDPDGATHDVLPPPFSARTLVHEYGGGSFLAHDGTVYFCNLDPKQPHADQRVYRIGSGAPEPLTSQTSARYADMDMDAHRNRLLAVRETHSDSGPEPVNEIVAIALDGSGDVRVLATGNDFYASPRLSPDGTQLAWISWDHPAMPWTDTELWVADIDAAGNPGNKRRVAGGPGTSVVQPAWSPDGALYFVTDSNNWWNLARVAGINAGAEMLLETEAEFAQPLWQLGSSTYTFLSADTLIAAACRDGIWGLVSIDLADQRVEILDLPYLAYRSLHVLGDRLVAIAASAEEPETLIILDGAGTHVEPVRAAFAVDADLKAYFSAPEAIAFPTAGDQTAYAFHYPPTNPGFVAPDGEKPPLIVMSHGGPTSAASGALALGKQFWTSRGFAVVDVNYRGSTGFGRDYRFKLQNQWGIADVEDCIAAAQYLIDQGKADPDRVGITGGSAGGYTTLCALTFHDFFKAGASHYGIGDLEMLAKDTHKFESRYLDGLIGAWPDEQATYRARSPIHHVERLNAPVAFFQGAQDKVVPPEQADAMVAALRAKNCPVAYVLFEDEQHGFRKGANIKRALDGELLFFSMWLSGRALRFFG